MSVFRKEYRELSQGEKDQVAEIKDVAERLYSLIDFPRHPDFSGNREIALAKTKLEESVMWAVKGITG